MNGTMKAIGRNRQVWSQTIIPDFPDGSIISAWRLRHFPGKPSGSDEFLPKLCPIGNPCHLFPPNGWGNSPPRQQEIAVRHERTTDGLTLTSSRTRGRSLRLRAASTCPGGDGRAGSGPLVRGAEAPRPWLRPVPHDPPRGQLPQRSAVWAPASRPVRLPLHMPPHAPSRPRSLPTPRVPPASRSADPPSAGPASRRGRPTAGPACWAADAPPPHPPAPTRRAALDAPLDRGCVPPERRCRPRSRRCTADNPAANRAQARTDAATLPARPRHPSTPPSGVGGLVKCASHRQAVAHFFGPAGRFSRQTPLVVTPRSLSRWIQLLGKGGFSSLENDEHTPFSESRVTGHSVRRHGGAAERPHIQLAGPAVSALKEYLCPLRAGASRSVRGVSFRRASHPETPRFLHWARVGGASRHARESNGQQQSQ
jgi:hypothetical protein